MSTPTHLQHIGNNIRQARKLREWNQQQLADQAGLRMATISDIESGKANFEINTLVRIAAALKCYVDITITPF